VLLLHLRPLHLHKTPVITPGKFEVVR
jgi:hypothetical protein